MSVISVRAAGAIMALTCLAQKDVQTVASVSLRTLDGAQVTLPMPSMKATVVIFLAVDCPVGNRYAPEIARICKAYSDKGIAFFRAYPDPNLKSKDAIKHGAEFGLKATALLDPKLVLAKAVGAKVTPEAAVIRADGTLLYRGRIDDWNVEHGRVKPNYRHDLRIALDEFLADKLITVPRTAAIGCFISP